MNIAFDEARKGKSTWTNPQVGAVIVKNGKILAQGHHEKFGGPHAEINTLNKLSSIDDALDADMYVTLEPCSHFGKTPPCVQRLVEVGIKRVYIGMQDPNPVVSGNGIKYLLDHGIAVKNLHEDGGINQAYIFYYQHQRPLITLKYAMTIDGKINQFEQKRSMITGKEAYQDSQKLRSDNQAILIGEHTLTIDNPKLTVRTEQMDFPPIRVVVVRDIDNLDSNLQIFKNSDSKVYFLTEKNTGRDLPGNITVKVGQWDVKAIVEFLSKENIESLLVEGGSFLQAACIKEKLIDNLVVYIAPKIFGGNSLPAVRADFESSEIDFEKPAITQLGPDIKLELRRLE